MVFTHVPNMVNQCQSKKSYGLDTKTCQEPYKFDLKVKVQGRIWIINVHDTSSHGDTPMCQNKRPMGHIAHLRKQFKLINTYDNIITLIKRRKRIIINFITIYCFLIWRNLNPPYPRMMLCANIGWNWLSGSEEEDFLISSMYFCS